MDVEKRDAVAPGESDGAKAFDESTKLSNATEQTPGQAPKSADPSHVADGVPASQVRLAFLRAVLPAKGWYCCVVFEDGQKKHYWPKTIEELAKVIEANDRPGCDVYFACAAYKKRGILYKGRSKDNVRAIKAFWFDIDLKKKNGDIVYPDKNAARKALFEFAAFAELPTPIVVDSGGGLHAYFILPHELTRDEWAPLARGLAEMAREHGLKFDPSRAADCASILRPPGTMNRKKRGAQDD
ncbi:MAG: hypothetical protein JO188_19065 [Hyphomicrobiales bacterium]|nr:hypothetical protein [Hyphomicrobiales bacterium]